MAPHRTHRALALARDHVDDGELEQRREDEDEAHRHPHVDRLDVGNAWQRRVGGRALRRHREDGEQTERDARRDGVDVNPERDPREDDDQQTRHVHLDEEEADEPLEDELDREAREGACTATTRSAM